MGYGTTTWTVTAERAEELRGEPGKQSLYGAYQRFEDKIVAEAVRRWRDESATRWDNETGCYPQMHAPVAFGCRNTVVDWDAVGVDIAHIIPIANDESVTTVTKNVKLTVPGDLADSLRRHENFYSMRSVRELLAADYPAAVLGEVTLVNVPAPRKPVAKATAGKAVTRYKIRPAETVNSRIPEVHTQLNKTYDSQADARETALYLLTEHNTLPAMTVEAVVVRETEDGSRSPALVTISRPIPEEAVITVAVTTHKVKPSPKIDRYEVTFWYHS